MTEAEQNILIAEACGWVAETVIVPVWVCTQYDGSGEYQDQSQILYSKDGHQFRPENLPHYNSCLNAMHEAEKVMTIHKYAAYEIELCKVVDASGLDSDIWHHVLCATAAQRAEAFIHAIGER